MKKRRTDFQKARAKERREREKSLDVAPRREPGDVFIDNLSKPEVQRAIGIVVLDIVVPFLGALMKAIPSSPTVAHHHDDTGFLVNGRLCDAAVPLIEPAPQHLNQHEPKKGSN